MRRVWNTVVQFLRDCINEDIKNAEAMQRGTVAGIAFLAPMAIMAAAKLGKGILSGIGKKKQAQEQARAKEANEQALFEERLASEGNTEDSRLARLQGIAEQLSGGRRALSPAVLAAMSQRRKSAVRKREIADESKGAGWGMAGDALGTAGEFANAYMAGSNPNAVSGSSRVMGGGGSAVDSDCPGGRSTVDGGCL